MHPDLVRGNYLNDRDWQLGCVAYYERQAERPVISMTRKQFRWVIAIQIGIAIAWFWVGWLAHVDYLISQSLK